MRILHIEMGHHLYGGALQALYLTEGLERRGHESLFICAKGSDVKAELVRRGLSMTAVTYRREADILLVFRIAAVARRFRPDIVHLHSRRGADFYGALGAKLGKTPAIVLSRRVDDPVGKGLWTKVRFEWLPDRVVGISQAICDILIAAGVDKRKVRCVRSAIDLTCYSDTPKADVREVFGLPSEALVVGVIAQLIERKGHEYLIRALPDIAKRVPEVRVIMFGQGTRRAELERLTKEIGVQRSVTFGGFRQDIADMLPSLDLVAHPALREGLGVSLMQAAACGVPVVASAVGGIPEVVRHEVTGLLLQAGDKKALADAVVKILSDEKLRQRMRKASREFALAELGVDAMVEGNIEVYREILREKGLA